MCTSGSIRTVIVDDRCELRTVSPTGRRHTPSFRVYPFGSPSRRRSRQRNDGDDQNRRNSLRWKRSREGKRPTLFTRESKVFRHIKCMLRRGDPSNVSMKEFPYVGSMAESGVPSWDSGAPDSNGPGVSTGHPNLRSTGHSCGRVACQWLIVMASVSALITLGIVVHWSV
jgi:hypothetical protein